MAETRIVRDWEGNEYEVVWAGDMKISLTKPRPSHRPDYIEPDSQEETQTRRKYTKTGRHVGEFKGRGPKPAPEATPPSIDWGLD